MAENQLTSCDAKYVSFSVERELRDIGVEEEKTKLASLSRLWHGFAEFTLRSPNTGRRGDTIPGTEHGLIARGTAMRRGWPTSPWGRSRIAAAPSSTRAGSSPPHTASSPSCKSHLNRVLLFLLNKALLGLIFKILGIGRVSGFENENELFANLARSLQCEMKYRKDLTFGC